MNTDTLVLIYYEFFIHSAIVYGILISGVVDKSKFGSTNPKTTIC